MSYRYTYHGKAYRFMDVEGFEKTIKNQKLRYSRVDCLNDPLDCGIHIIPALPNLQFGSRIVGFVIRQ